MRVIAPDGLADQGIAELCKAKMDINDGTLDRNELLRDIDDYDALIVRSATKVDEELLSHAPNLKVVGRAGVGIDNIDLHATEKYGVTALFAPNGNTRSTAEHTFALIMAAARCIPQAYARLQEGKWCKSNYERLGMQLKDKTLGIIGCGRIGLELACIATAFGMNVIGHDPNPLMREPGFPYVDKDTLLETSDVISIHTPKLPEPTINSYDIMKMNKRPIIVNASRGGNVDEVALKVALDSRRVSAAAFDVYENEGEDFNTDLFESPYFIGTPHLAACTDEAQTATSIEIAQAVISYLHFGEWTNSANLSKVSEEETQFHRSSEFH